MKFKTEDNEPLILGTTYYYQNGDGIIEFILGDNITIINLERGSDNAPKLTYFGRAFGDIDLQRISIKVYKDKEILKSNMINTLEFNYKAKENRIKSL